MPMLFIGPQRLFINKHIELSDTYIYSLITSDCCHVHVFRVSYCMRTLTRHSWINYMDQCITKSVLQVYLMDTWSILCC